MGYGLGVFLLALGLILARRAGLDHGVDLTTVGWILVLAGVLVIVLTAVQHEPRPPATTVATTTHADGSQTVTEQSAATGPAAGGLSHATRGLAHRDGARPAPLASARRSAVLGGAAAR